MSVVKPPLLEEARATWQQQEAAELAWECEQVDVDALERAILKTWSFLEYCRKHLSVRGPFEFDPIVAATTITVAPPSKSFLTRQDMIDFARQK